MIDNSVRSHDRDLRSPTIWSTTLKIGIALGIVLSFQIGFVSGQSNTDRSTDVIELSGTIERLHRDMEAIRAGHAEILTERDEAVRAAAEAIAERNRMARTLAEHVISSETAPSATPKEPSNLTTAPSVDSGESPNDRDRSFQSSAGRVGPFIATSSDRHAAIDRCCSGPRASLGLSSQVRTDIPSVKPRPGTITAVQAAPEEEYQAR